MKISVEKLLKSSKISSDTLLVFAKSQKKKSFDKELSDIDKEFSGLIKDYVQMEEFKFDNAKTLTIALTKQNKVSTRMKSIKKLILVGLGDGKEENDKKLLRKAYASAIRSAKARKAQKLLAFSVSDPVLLAEQSVLLTYSFDKYKSESKKSPKKPTISELKISSSQVSAGIKKKIKEAQIIAESTCKARDLVWEPPCVVTPSFLAAEAKKIKAKNIRVTVKEAADCKKLGMGAYLAVAQAGDQAPKFIEITYKPTGKVKKHIALIGKGVTFDSGGLSLKPPKAMEMMKEDMSGSAAIIGIMNAISKIQPSGLQITAIIAATENMPSGKAYKPGDVITAMNGKTIEVNNTDAEGRLTLADAVTYASKKYPDEIIDFATLTGACMVALGNVCAGLMGNNQDLIDKLKESSAEVGELMWQLPLYEEYKKGLKSTIADVINAGSGGKAGAQNGALFIQEFVGEQKDAKEPIPWAHIDIAGPCWYDQDMDWAPKGASGMPVRTILNYILN